MGKTVQFVMTAVVFLGIGLFVGYNLGSQQPPVANATHASTAKSDSKQPASKHTRMDPGRFRNKLEYLVKTYDMGGATVEDIVGKLEEVDSSREERFHVTFPKPDGDRIEALEKSDLIVDGWFATDKQPDIRATLDGAPLEVRFRNRDDVRKYLPDHTWLVGWMVRIPKESVEKGAQLVITLNSREVLNAQVIYAGAGS